MYELVEVARWAGVPAWEFMDKPAAFYFGYLQAMSIDNHVEQEIMKRGANA